MPVVNTTNTFTNNEQITSTKLNDIMDNSSFVSGAVVTSGGLEITAGGQMQIASDGVTTARILNSNVTTAKIADGAVTPAKLATGGPAWSGTTGSIVVKQPALELGEGITSNTTSLIDFHSVHPLTDYETRIARDTGVDGWFAIANQGAGRISFSSAGGFQFADAHMPNPVGNAPLFGVRAWVNFNGRTTNGTCTIRSSGNVSSVVRTNTGKYTVNFTTPMQGLNYMAICNSGSAGTPRFACADRTSITTSSIKIEIDNISGGPADLSENNVMIME